MTYDELQAIKAQLGIQLPAVYCELQQQTDRLRDQRSHLAIFLDPEGVVSANLKSA